MWLCPMSCQSVETKRLVRYIDGTSERMAKAYEVEALRKSLAALRSQLAEVLAMQHAQANSQQGLPGPGLELSHSKHSQVGQDAGTTEEAVQGEDTEQVNAVMNEMVADVADGSTSRLGLDDEDGAGHVDEDEEYAHARGAEVGDGLPGREGTSSGHSTSWSQGQRGGSRGVTDPPGIRAVGGAVSLSQLLERIMSCEERLVLMAEQAPATCAAAAAAAVMSVALTPGSAEAEAGGLPGREVYEAGGVRAELRELQEQVQDLRGSRAGEGAQQAAAPGRRKEGEVAHFQALLERQVSGCMVGG